MKLDRSVAQAHPIARVLSLVGAALLAVVLIGSPAMAQIGSVGDTVKDVGGTVGGATGPIGDTVKDVGGTVGDTTGSVGGTVGDTVKDVGGTVGDNVGGPVGGAVKDTTNAVGGAVKDTTNSAGGAVKDTTKELGTAINGVTDTVVGENTRGEKNHGTKKDGKLDGRKNGRKDRQKGGSEVSSGSIQFGEGAYGFGTRVPAISLNGMEASREIAGGQVAAFAPDPLNVGALAEAALDAAKKFAFPISLAVLVALFMLIQDRVDRKDPKLALAAVDSEQDWLSFA